MPTILGPFTIGQRVRVGNESTLRDAAGNAIGAFKNSAGLDTDPTGVTIGVEKPNGVVTTYTYSLATVLKETTGRFYVDLTPDVAGVWSVKETGTGTVVAAMQMQFFVYPDLVG